MISKVAAKRYAKALFAVGKEEDKLEAYQQELNGIARILRESPELIDALTNPVYPTDMKVRLMGDLAGVFKLSPIMGNFMKLLVEKRRVLCVPDIGELFQKLTDELMGVKRAVVTAVIPLDEDVKRRIQEALEKVTGKKVILNTEQDPSIIGGLVVRAGDMVWDGSVRSQLLDIKEIIKRGEGS
ncbi:MAG: ATP synthase F1 subunit delta [Thermodesulfobacteriota bacterium]